MLQGLSDHFHDFLDEVRVKFCLHGCDCSCCCCCMFVRCPLMPAEGVSKQQRAAICDGAARAQHLAGRAGSQNSIYLHAAFVRVTRALCLCCTPALRAYHTRFGSLPKPSPDVRLQATPTEFAAWVNGHDVLHLHV